MYMYMYMYITLYKNLPSHAGRIRGDFYFVLQKCVYF